ncbi:unnamed protein product [Spirodela intermedia]|uniref:O-fucosyltransferase family protein n=1 Tax=Spirodela intermedia TaxID=51605 RepID=A0A7I8IPS1_SPIIN|nr:unnamed protein product [Spirodela intermedia]CAA6659800.1 unnamed protein product [Spirodela intermedia]
MSRGRSGRAQVLFTRLFDYIRLIHGSSEPKGWAGAAAAGVGVGEDDGRPVSIQRRRKVAEEILRRPASTLLRRSTLRRSSHLLFPVPLPLLGGPKSGRCIPTFPFVGWDQCLCSAPTMQRRIFVPMGNGERFLLYAPHSGFSNQLSELRNAILFAAILNRTLVVPRCPKFRVSSPSDLRASVWDHTMELLRSRRFVSMADVIDLSPMVSASMVRFVDFSEFASVWCGIDMNLVCTVYEHESLPKEFTLCKDILSGLDMGAQNCVYGVEDDCRTTVWTYGQDSDGSLDSFQLDKELQERKKISYIRRRRDVLVFGSLFSAPYKGNELYIDIHDVPTDSRIQSLLRKIDYLPFAQEILNAGKEFALNKIKGPFLCAQLRLLDGQFKNHWKEAFSTLRQKIELIQADKREKKNKGPISIFVMTDLPAVNWTGTYLADLLSNSSSFKFFTLPEDNKLVAHASLQLMSARHSLRTPLLLENRNITVNKRICPPLILPSILLYVQEVVCSCASLGFVGLLDLQLLKTLN